MTPEGIRIERDGAVLVIRFDRPGKKNAITSAMYTAMAQALEAADHDESIAASVFLGTPGMFTAGNDIAEFAQMASEAQGLGQPVLRFLRALATGNRPLLAGVDGLAVGVGATLLFHCDFVLATPAAVLRTPFTALGLVPEAASSLLAPRTLGHARAFELLVMGRDMDAESARASGLVNRIVPADHLEAEAMTAAHEIAALPRAALLAARSLLKGDPSDILRRVDAEAAIFAERLRSAEAQAAFAAFMGTRKS